jgi:hypothetical protein
MIKLAQQKAKLAADKLLSDKTSQLRKQRTGTKASGKGKRTQV